MVPKVAGKGRNFVGAGLYYLHDKKALTTGRVAFTHTENLPTRDPDKAIKCMAWTALRQDQLKVRSGGSSKGRKLTQPVYCYSLSWAPGEEPSQEEMIGAAKETLKELGLEQHEALFVGHNDEPHPHIHVIVNRVHPETGIAAKLSMDHLKLSKWAEAFERRQGQIRCEQRVENNELRRQGEFVKDKGSQHSAEFHRWRQERVARQHDKRAMETMVLDARQERERDQLRMARDRRIEEKRQQVRDATRADWRDLYAIQRQEQGRLAAAQRNVWTRVRFFTRTHGEEFRAAGKSARKEMLKGAASALMGSRRQYSELERKQQKERRFFAGRLKQRTKELTRGIYKEHERRLSELRERQSRELSDLRSRQSEESQQQAREIREGRDKEIYRKERPRNLRSQFNKASRGDDARSSGGSARGGKQAAPPREAQSAAKTPTEKQQHPPSRMDSFKENAKDVTGKTTKRSHGPGGLGSKFREAAKDKGKESSASMRDAFQENKSDIEKTQDAGRERSRTIKPPGPKKPD